jgi:hypothetical protein
VRIRAGQLLLVAGLTLTANAAGATMIPVGGFAAAVASETNPNQTYVFDLVPNGAYTNEFATWAAPTIINGNGATLTVNEPPPNMEGVFTSVHSLTVNNLTFIGTKGVGTPGMPGTGSSISVGNGANSSAIRQQNSASGGVTLSVNGVTIENFQMGILTGVGFGGMPHTDTITVAGSHFLNNGVDSDVAMGAFGHAFYASDDALSVAVTNSTFCGQEHGHDVKSRAGSTTVTGNMMYVGTNSGAPGGCNVGSTSNAIDLPNGGTGNIDMNQIFQGDANENGSMIRYGEDGSPFTINTLDVSNTKFNLLDTKSGTAIDELNGCGSTPNITSTGNTFNNAGTGGSKQILTQVNPPGCLSSGSSPGPNPGPTAAVPEPSSLGLLLAALGCCAFWGLRARAV